MREVYTEILKSTFRDRIIVKREEMNLTQNKMSELLAMAERSYQDLENGKSCCSAVTLVLYLIYYCEDVQGFLDELKDKFEKAGEDVD